MSGWATTLSLCGSCHKGRKEYKVLLAREDKTACKECKEFKVLLGRLGLLGLPGLLGLLGLLGLQRHRSIYNQ